MSSHGANAYYPWYVRDYRSSRKVQRMGYIARGLYRELLDEEFLEGSLPDDIGALADICGCPVRVMERAWKELEPCFQQIDGRLVNEKLEEMRTEKDKIRVKRADAGRKGGIAKQKVANANQVPANAKQMPYSRAEHEQCNATHQEEEASPSSLEATSEQVRPEAFANTWNRERGPLPKVQEFTDERRKKVQARIRGGITLERFCEAVACCREKPFLRGENNSGWVATFDWLIANGTNLQKAIEQPYGAGSANGIQTGKGDHNLEVLRQSLAEDLADQDGANGTLYLSGGQAGPDHTQALLVAPGGRAS
jgi:hypothetical protein